MKYCGFCGHCNDDNAKLCGGCVKAFQITSYHKAHLTHGSGSLQCGTCQGTGERE